MTILNQIQKIVVFLITLLLSLSIYGQQLIESRQTSYYTYIYKLTNEEAYTIYKNSIWKVDSTYFHTLVDSFPTDRPYDGKLKKGHYLKTFADKNKQKVSITTIQDFDVFIFNNNTDLCIQVYDINGNLINDADVRINHKKLEFNSIIKSYLDKKSNQKGLLRVTQNGFTAYYDLSRQYNNSSIKRGTRKIVYGTPIKYVWLPVKYVVSLPVDGIKSISSSWPQGTIYRTKNFFANSYKRIACLFDDYHCSDYATEKFRNRHTGYIVFNKPKFAPRDTVKFKAFVVTNKGKPIAKNVKVILSAQTKDIELAKLAPYSVGGYTYDFYLHDSLQLQLDRNYTIRLELNSNKEYIHGSFKYEDYELSKNELEVRVDSSEHYKNKKVTLFVKGTDENELNLLDARIELLLTPSTINNYFDKRVFMPDTLLYLNKKLLTTDDTEIVISDSLFPKANFGYSANVRLLTSDNEPISKKKEISYYYETEKFDITLKADSINFGYLKNGTKTPKQVFINSIDNFGNKTLVFKGLTPHSLKLNPYYATYAIESDTISDAISVFNEPSLIQCFSERTKDSLYIHVDNPRSIPFVYNIYKRNSQQSYGYTDSLKVNEKVSTKENYFVSIRYLWGGKVKEENYKIPLIEKKLNIEVTQPKIVYPGQKSTIEILVTDTEGKFVEGVDLTAFSLTKKFGYDSPDVQNLEKVKKNKNLINNFNFKDFDLSEHLGLKLDYDLWKLVAGLDSIQYYQFIYPKNSIYRFEYNTQEAITQFAPFVVSEGVILPIHVIYVDGKPVYFSWSTNMPPYSFPIESGYHEVKLRTTNKEIIIDSLFINIGKKLIFSLDNALKNKNVKINNVEPKLSDYEKNLLYKYIVPYRNNFGEHYAYLHQNSTAQLLSSHKINKGTGYAGPFSGNLTFQLIEGFSTVFNHEPFFEYEFEDSLLKMRSIESIKYPQNLRNYTAVSSLTDSVFTKTTFEKQWLEYVSLKRFSTAKYSSPNATNAGAGRLRIHLKKDSNSVKDVPLNILIFRLDNPEFVRVYPGNTSLVHQLKEGQHRVLFFYPEGKYHIEDSISIEPNGLNFYRFTQPSSLQKDSLSTTIGHIIERMLYNVNKEYKQVEKNMKHSTMYPETYNYTGPGTTVEGYVYEEGTGFPLPGVNVMVKGTSYGATTDFDGYFVVKVPEGNTLLIFNYIGFASLEKTIELNVPLKVQLKEDTMSLDEIIVTGYGVQKKSSITGAYTVYKEHNANLSQSLQGKVAGVQIISARGVPGSAYEIAIRGASSLSFDKTPLFIINGSVFTGDISELDPSMIKNIEVLKDAKAISIYGVKGVNGVVIIETHIGTFRPIQSIASGADYDATSLEAMGESSSIRTNFSDYAFWKPSLKTDKNGKVRFDVVFPDDVTSWDTHYLAMNGRRQSGKTGGIIKSYKPLMAQLALPRFLVQSDTAFAIGKVLNYTPDSTRVLTKAEINGNEVLHERRVFRTSLIDTLSIPATKDSLKVKYYLETEEGYVDGEEREIPVFAKGLQETKGNFYVLDKDTTLQLQFEPDLGQVNLYVRADMLDVFEDEISKLINYKYSCNEQIASKLKALTAEKTIATYSSKPFKNDKLIEKLLALLQKNQKENGLWGWWKNAKESLWISLHVLEALTNAENLGYKSSVDKNKAKELLMWELVNSKDFYEKIRMLKILNLLGSKIDFQKYVSSLEKTGDNSLNAILNILELKQLTGIAYNLDTLNIYKKTTLFGNEFYSDKNESLSLLNNDIQNTLLAYRLFRADSIVNVAKLNKLLNYFLENRKNGYWRNTFESAQIIETVLPELLKGKSKATKSSLQIKGGYNATISEFPFEMKLAPSDGIELSRSGDFPIYFTAYQNYWNNNPIPKMGDFEIVTYFDNISTPYLKAGTETKLITKIIVNKDAEYVMLNIPIPGGCSYSDKKNNLRNETHREYFKNETTIFFDSLKKGEYTFEIDLIARYSGTYTLNPAKIELMYFPTFSANNEVKTLKIK